MVAVVGITSVITSKYISQKIIREKEAELLFNGIQYLNAIKSYYEFRNLRTYPRTLDDLLRDPRSLSERHLRRLYPEPFNDAPLENENLGWSLIRNDSGLIVGVSSSSKLEPIKQANFPSLLVDFENSESYEDWEFIYRASLN